MNDDTSNAQSTPVGNTKEAYVAPNLETHRPMDIMSKYDDRSSELDS